jgi:hypothetical protein
LSFYTQTPNECLRLGDIITGFQLATPHIEQPSSSEINLEATIKVSRPKHLAVMTPCCALDKGMISVAPLIEISSAMFRNPHFQEDFTIINRVVEPSKSVPPKHLEAMSVEERARHLSSPAQWVFLDFFCFGPAACLPQYLVKREKLEWQTVFWMIDFKEIAVIKCPAIVPHYKPPVGIKLLQLSVKSREALREKMAQFFGRPTDEDMRELTV